MIFKQVLNNFHVYHNCHHCGAENMVVSEICLNERFFELECDSCKKEYTLTWKKEDEPEAVLITEQQRIQKTYNNWLLENPQYTTVEGAVKSVIGYMREMYGIS